MEDIVFNGNRFGKENYSFLQLVLDSHPNKAPTVFSIGKYVVISESPVRSLSNAVSVLFVDVHIIGRW